MNQHGWGHAHSPESKGGVPPWVWILVAAMVAGGVLFGGCIFALVLVTKDEARRASHEPTSANDGEVVIVTAEAGQPPADVFRAAAVTARARGLQPFVYATASWCEPCKKLDRAMSDPRMKDAFAGTYVVKLDIDEVDDGALAAIGMRVRAVPSFYELGADGMPTGRSLIGDWGADVPENMAPALKRFFGGR